MMSYKCLNQTENIFTVLFVVVRENLLYTNPSVLASTNMDAAGTTSQLPMVV